MCVHRIGEYTAQGLAAALAVFEERSGISSVEFERRFESGELDGSFAFNLWHQLLNEYKDFVPTPAPGDEYLVQHVREVALTKATA